jgi:thiamine-phosphate pyrophosphorylase
MTDRERLPDPQAAVARLPAGVRSRLGQRFRSGVIVRERDPAALEKLVRRLMPLCRRQGVALIVANDVRLALRLGADGIHLAEKTLSNGLARLLSTRRRWRRRLAVTASAHTVRATLRACALNVDAILIAPVFATGSHPGDAYLGAIRFAALARRSKARSHRIPIVALGGVTSRNANRLIAAGASGFAAIESLS